MADYFQTIIDTGVEPKAADHLARHVVTYLAERGVIDGYPSEDGGYSRGPRALDISTPPLGKTPHETIPPVYSHLQVMIGRSIHSGDLSQSRTPEARCPSCGRPLEDPDDEWSAAVQAWLSGDDDSSLRCPGCGSAASVAGWEYGSDCGFGALAFRFWNWPPLSATFLEQLKEELGHPIAVVRGRL